ncbi:MATE family efflux transporter [Actinomadura citrea]|jgi:Na+-driven multidrug efflux pump|uniref:MATE family efflux transporter n=1 Tax=Actinomadura citrea TaxID=46158 RepID=UPI002E2B0693|nr:MATE family efflux transporter [Actinomadura citrea]
MTAPTAQAAQSPQTVRAAHRRRIARLAAPMAAAQLLAIMVPIVIVAILGWMGDEAIRVRSLYFPLAFLFFGVQVAFDVTNQTITALRTGRGERDVGATTMSVAVVWLGTGLALGIGLSLAAPALADVLGADAQGKDLFVRFLRWMSLANLTLAWPVLCASALRGAGRAGPAALIMLVGSAVEVAGLAVLGFGCGLDIAALPLATALNGLTAGAFGMVVLARTGLLREWGWRPEVLGYLLRTGVPVSLTNIVMFGMNFAFVLMLKPFGPDVIAGFATATTVQNLVIMPAVVLGSAAAILMNQSLGASGREQVAAVLGAALRTTLAVYAVIVPVLWLLRGVIGHLTAENERIAGETARYIAIVGPSFVVLGLVLTALMALEQTGGARLALAASAVYVAGSVGIGALAGRGAGGPVPLYVTIGAMNTAGVLAVLAAVAFVRAQDRRRRTSREEPAWGAAPPSPVRPD